MPDLLEDPDGAPYPEPVQKVIRALEAPALGLEEFEIEAARNDVANAIESVIDSLRESGRFTPELLPAESMALTTALAQVLRGDEPTPNVATVCVVALARLTGRHDWTKKDRS